MAVPENASLMPFYTLRKGQQVRFTALDATSGADVTAVVISQMVIGVEAEPTGVAVVEPTYDPQFSAGGGEI